MQYVQCFGALWKLTDANFKRLQRDVLQGKDVDLDRMGTMIATEIHNLVTMQEKSRSYDNA